MAYAEAVTGPLVASDADQELYWRWKKECGRAAQLPLDTLHGSPAALLDRPGSLEEGMPRVPLALVEANEEENRSHSSAEA